MLNIFNVSETTSPFDDMHGREDFTAGKIAILPPARVEDLIGSHTRKKDPPIAPNPNEHGLAKNLRRKNG